MTWQPFNPAKPEHQAALVAVWNAACGPDLAFNLRLSEFNTRPTPGIVRAGQIVYHDDTPVGVVLASAMEGAADPRRWSWIDALAVAPARQRQGLGTRLIAWAEAWLAEHGARHVSVGGGLRPFTPGLPTTLGQPDFFTRRGYQTEGAVWDVARRLVDYAAPPTWPTVDVRPAKPADADALDEFLSREFPERWRFEYQEFRREGGRLSDYVVLWEGGRIEGFCHLTLEDSAWPIERLYMRRLPRPWGQLGPIGVGSALRGRGYGGALLDAGLRELRARGVDGCVIDWTGLLDFYGKFGFQPYRQYTPLTKTLRAADP